MVENVFSYRWKKFSVVVWIVVEEDLSPDTKNFVRALKKIILVSNYKIFSKLILKKIKLTPLSELKVETINNIGIKNSNNVNHLERH